GSRARKRNKGTRRQGNKERKTKLDRNKPTTKLKITASRKTASLRVARRPQRTGRTSPNRTKRINSNHLKRMASTKALKLRSQVTAQLSRTNQTATRKNRSNHPAVR